MKKAAKNKTPEAKADCDPRPAMKVNNSGLPEHFRQYFWDCDFNTVTWRKNKADIVLRVLVRGTWDDVKWVREKAGDKWLREWLVARKGRALERPDLRFWGLILRIPRRQVTSWLNDEARQIWDRRTYPRVDRTY